MAQVIDGSDLRQLAEVAAKIHEVLGGMVIR
jgi:hypothetical protein